MDLVKRIYLCSLDVILVDIFISFLFSLFINSSPDFNMLEIVLLWLNILNGIAHIIFGLNWFEFSFLRETFKLWFIGVILRFSFGVRGFQGFLGSGSIVCDHFGFIIFESDDFGFWLLFLDPFLWFRTSWTIAIDITHIDWRRLIQFLSFGRCGLFDYTLKLHTFLNFLDLMLDITCIRFSYRGLSNLLFWVRLTATSF